MARFGLIALFALLALPFLGCELFEGETIVVPPRNLLFFVHVEARLIGGNPGVNGFVEATCAPLQDPSCSGDCTYKLEVDGFSHGSTLTGTRFALVLPSDEIEYGFRCVHEPSGSRSDTAYLLVP